MEYQKTNLKEGITQNIELLHVQVMNVTDVKILKVHVNVNVMENSIKTIRQIESSHRGLGIPLHFANLCSLADISCFYIGEMGSGKGTLIKSIKAYDVDYDMNLYTINIVTLFKKFYNEGHGIVDKKILWRVDEWSTLKEVHRDMFMSLGAELITDHRYSHVSGASVYQSLELKMENIILVAFVGIQPIKFAHMTTGEQVGETWNALTSDRFLKFALINPLRTKTNRATPEYTFSPRLPRKELVTVNSELGIMKMALKDQVSEDRLPLFCESLIKAYCKYEGYETVTPKAEIEFKKLFGFYLSLYGMFTYTLDINEGNKFSCGAFRLLNAISRHEGKSFPDLIEYFKIYNKSGKEENYIKEMKMELKILERYDLAHPYSESEPRMYTSQRVDDYFQWYRNVMH